MKKLNYFNFSPDMNGNLGFRSSECVGNVGYWYL